MGVLTATSSGRLLGLLLGIICICIVPLPHAVAAESAPSLATSGLQITPVRDEQKVTAGSRTNGSIVIANLTDSKMTVSLQVQKFSVTNLTYDYRFSDPGNSWVHTAQTSITLDSQQSKTVPYSLTPDARATPGGYYYSFIASTDSSRGSIPVTLRAVSLLFVTIAGDLKHTGSIDEIHVPRLVVAKQFDVSADVRNTGNTYYFAAITGRVKGPLTGTSASPQNHLVIPNKLRRVSSSINSPALPGIYPVEITYTSDTGVQTHASQLVLFIQPWSIAVVLGAVLLLQVIHANQRTPANRDREDES